MAGAGYKLFNTGDVLTAAQVNTYLMEQTVMVFANAAARTTALSGVVSEGMISYLKDTNAVEVYDGSNWVSSDDPNAIQNTIVDAKGDLISASAADTPARLAVGNNGETLVADSSTSTGLRWGNNYGFTAGKNLLINGDLRINQRAFTSTTAAGTYTFDRFCTTNSGGTVTYSAQTFTAGAAPVAGYEAINYLRIVTASQGVGDYAAIFQPVEDVRTMAGKTFTVSFWAKAASGTPKMFVIGRQKFGSGGSADADGVSSQFTLTTSWQRYSVSVVMPSISGKTIGTGSYTQVFFLVSDGNGSMGAQNNTFDLWGFQVEQGSVATAFQTATGTLAGELCAAQRYYYRVGGDVIYQVMGFGSARGGTQADINVVTPVKMRVAPTSLDYGTFTNLALNAYAGAAAYALSAAPTLATNNTSTNNAAVLCTIATASLTTGAWTNLISNNTTQGYIGLSAEL